METIKATSSTPCVSTAVVDVIVDTEDPHDAQIRTSSPY